MKNDLLFFYDENNLILDYNNWSKFEIFGYFHEEYKKDSNETVEKVIINTNINYMKKNYIN